MIKNSQKGQKTKKCLKQLLLGVALEIALKKIIRFSAQKEILNFFEKMLKRLKRSKFSKKIETKKFQKINFFEINS